MSTDFHSYLTGTAPFQSYLYSYPHKSAYRRLEKPVNLRELWAPERRDALFLYSHIPFCRSKCAFCNLFSLSSPDNDLVELYLTTLQMEAEVLRESLDRFQFAGYAIGGGTPTLLSARQLERLFAIYSKTLGVDLAALPGSIELSPDTVTEEKLALLAERKISRVSLGIQSFLESEAKTMGRIQTSSQIHGLLERIAALDFPAFNIDLIYGIPGQTTASWLASLERAVSYRPAELFLYPLYLRPLTSLFDRTSSVQDPDIRPELYEIGRDFLAAQGYLQDSMRLFRLTAAILPGSDYSCQEDGMVGLGTNSRSYTRTFHYATPYAVSRTGVNNIIREYTAKTRENFETADYGIHLTQDDVRRRYLIKSLLKSKGLDEAYYLALFASTPVVDFPELLQLEEAGLAIHSASSLRLTKEGMGLSDLIGCWFISKQVKHLMAESILQ